MVNAFWLDRDLTKVRRWLVDRHVTSSVFECSMVLTTAAQVRGYDGDDLYFTHVDHPLTQWAAASHGNWLRLREYVELAHEEWRYRWEHDSERVHDAWATASTVDPAALADRDWPDDGRSDPPQLTGEWGTEDYVEAYRLYYANDKRHLFSWTNRERPPWLDEYTVEATDCDGPAADRR